MRPRKRIADLFCGAGGAAMGLHRAGFEVVGFDIKPQKNYPYEFHQRDAMTMTPEELRGFDAVWASPPCQDYSKVVRHLSKSHPRLIEPIKVLLERSNKPWIVENVIGAPIPAQGTLFGDNGVMLCGSAFGLQCWRHRLFLTTFPVPTLPCQHAGTSLNPWNTAKGIPAIREALNVPPGTIDPERAWKDHMGLKWMKHRDEWREAIPPAYSEYLGKELMKVLESGLEVELIGYQQRQRP